MLNQDHPADERLAALADEGDTDARGTDARGDAESRAHVTSCDRCARIVQELSLLSAALADLPDVAPHRPLRLLPSVEPETASGIERLGQWARRLFGPALTAGVALAMAGAVGTALPALDGATQGGAAGTDSRDSRLEVTAQASSAPGATAQVDVAAPASGGAEAYSSGGVFNANGAGSSPEDDGAAAQVEDDEPLGFDGPGALPVERSPWPMVLFAGITLMIAAALLRWILAPPRRSGSAG